MGFPSSPCSMPSLNAPFSQVVVSDLRVSFFIAYFVRVSIHIYGWLLLGDDMPSWVRY